VTGKPSSADRVCTSLHNQQHLIGDLANDSSE
jgi:hypothetical protein